MKKSLIRYTVFVAGILLIAGNHLQAQSDAPDLTPKSVLEIMQRVADWQLANPANPAMTGWIQAAGEAGLMALAGISGDTKYRDAMRAMGEANNWKLGARLYDADDHCVGQTYAELYLLYRDPKMIAPMRERFDAILAKPSEVTSLEFTTPQSKARENWSWCDSLFMGPPTWVRLAAATSDARYTDFAVKNWWRTADYLYDKDEHLFFRDSTFFKKQEANGKKVFWSRGNGWVMGGLVRTLQYLPMNHPDRPRFEKLFKEMSEKIMTCQQPDGLWHASLLDPASYPLKETSGSGFYTYALAWGVNQGLLERTNFEPAVKKAWTALVSCVAADGKFTHVQPVGSDPKNFAEDSTAPYGIGSFLLAGSEVYRLAVLNNAKVVAVKTANPAAFWRESETVEVYRRGSLPEELEKQKVVVMDGVSSRILDSQIYVPYGEKWAPDYLIFQVDLAPNETRTFYILPASALAAEPQPIVKTFARYVPERFDDFAWESDRIAHRAYGLALMPAEGTTNSSPDVWIKKDRRLIVDTMYATKHYHEDNGEFMDDYRVGKSRGCGGLGIWDEKKLYTSLNWRHCRLITTGPVRSVFELVYDPWEVGNGRKISEVRRISIDAGSWFSKMESTLSCDDKLPLTVGVGLAERACGTNGTELIRQDQAEGWMTYWQPEDKPKGITATAIVLPKGSVTEFTTDNQNLDDSKIHAEVPQPTHEGAPPIRNLLAITKINANETLAYYFGACWDRSGDFTNHEQWEAYVKRFAERRDQPVQVTIGN